MKYKLLIFLLLSLYLGNLYSGYYFPQDTARTEGMGRTGLGIVSGIEAGIKNPARAYTDKTQVLVEYKKFMIGYSGVKDVPGYISPEISLILTGVGFNLFKGVGSSVIMNSLIVPEFYTEHLFGICFSIKKEIEDIEYSAGIRKKVVYIDLGSSWDKVMNLYSDVGFCIGYGKFTGSILITNLINTDDSHPAEIHIGGSYSPLDILFLNIEFCFNKNYFIPKLGVEYWINKFAVRCGANSDEVGLGVGLDLGKFYCDISTNLGLRYYSLNPSVKISFIYNL